LMGLDSITVNSACIEFHLLCENIRNDPIDIAFIIWWTLPILIKAI